MGDALKHRPFLFDLKKQKKQEGWAGNLLLKSCRCGKLIPQGDDMCPECRRAESSRHMIYNRTRRNKQAAAFYVSPEWRKVRNMILQRNDYIDLYILYTRHEIVAATMVHHIVEISDDWDLRLDVNNLIPLSDSCHAVISAAYKKSEKSKKDMQKMLSDILRRHNALMCQQSGGAGC